MKKTILLLLVSGLITLVGSSANAQKPPPRHVTATSERALGFRTGYTSWHDVQQLHLGAHVKAGELFPNVQFTPNVEIGFGGHTTIITVNGDLAYSFTELVTQPWNIYGGGSLSFNTFNPRGSSVQVHLGLSLLGGLERTFDNGNQGLVEMRFGILDSPSFKLTFGYTLF